MLTWERVRKWCREPDQPRRYTKWFWAALLATYGLMTKENLLNSAAQITARHREHPDYAIGPQTLVCSCHMQPRFLNIVGDACWEGDYSQAAWHHFPLVRAYLLALLAGDMKAASNYLMEFAVWRHSSVEAYDLAWSIGDLARAHWLARRIVNDQPQRVYFFCREDVNDPELLERAQEGLMESDRRSGFRQAHWCATASNDEEFLKRIPEELKPRYAA